ncbi:nicotinate-nucleotide adenylyltransferase [Agaribacterium haliotis]|uniref:nicotinate-nucleotide adenylyltransferase n=1 Tax=Agaribacterium haliotis TaxID=2013869 RepID=UPI000BB55A3E|nr:nicotinate-nucleotide adenylyltransferase [Agaribacterium haliotis]
MAANKCIAIYGGSFDPPHRGHLALAAAALEQCAASELRFLPCAEPPHKAQTRADAGARMAMLQAAIEEADDRRYRLDDREIKRRGPSYSQLSLSELRAELGPSASLIFVIGWDSLQNLDRWHRWRELFLLGNFAVAARPGYRQLDSSPVAKELANREVAAAQLAAHPAGAIARLDMAEWPLSSTELRSLMAGGVDDNKLTTMISPAVLKVIKQRSLYRGA